MEFIPVLEFSGARGPPQFLKNRSENARANENLSYVFPSIPWIAPGVAPRIVVFVLLKPWDAILRMVFLIPRILSWTPTAVPRILRNSLRAPRMAFSLQERFPSPHLHGFLALPPKNRTKVPQRSSLEFSWSAAPGIPHGNPHGHLRENSHVMMTSKSLYSAMRTPMHMLNKQVFARAMWRLFVFGPGFRMGWRQVWILVKDCHSTSDIALHTWGI